MSLRSGTKIGPYEIQAPLGAGGMGEVYRARDTRLGRDVALKILPVSFARDEDRLHRFEQESQAVAALNHPNILAIYDVGQHEGVPFLISELLQGDSLRTLLDQGVLPQRKAIDYGVQIAQGLAAAHQKGIVHRDLKPENLFVTAEGQIKILDFGLAKLAAKADTNADGLTLTNAHTAIGVVMGTAGYMAPEQVRGEAVDPRTDIFAFGAVMFEVLSGQRAFRRDSTAETMTAVLKEDPPESAGLQNQISPAVDRIVRRCLEKNPDQRFQSARDLSFALGALSGTDLSASFRAVQVSRNSRLWPWVAAALALAVIALAAWRLTTRAPVVSRMQFAIPVPGEVSHLALSPDGVMLAFVSPDEQSSEPMLYVQRIGSAVANQLLGTEGASYPFWSPDDAYVAFFSQGKLYKISATGGARQVLATAPTPRGGSWSSKGPIVYAPVASGPLWKVNADGSNAAPLTDKIFVDRDNSHRWPVFLPDGDHFIFWSGDFTNVSDNRTSGIYITSLEAKGKTLVVLCRSNPGYGAGQLFYINDKAALLAAPMDVSAGKITGEARVLAGQVAFQPSVYWGVFAVSQEGTLIYNSVNGASFSTLTWHDRTGKALGQVGEPGVLANPTLSPDDSHATVDTTDVKANNVDVWIHDLVHGTSARFTFDPAEEVAGTWSRDGSLIAYRSVAGGTVLYVKKKQGLEPPKMVATMPESEDLIPTSWTADDQQILATEQPPDGSCALLLIPVSGATPIPFLKTKFCETNGQISPDGKWVAYASNESGDWEIYVTTFPNAAGKWQISRGGGTEPRWRGDNKEIFYIDPDGTMMAVSVDESGTFSSRTPSPLFSIHARPAISSTDLFTYDVTKDGMRFLVNGYIKPDHVVPLTIVQNALADAAK